MEFLNVHSSTLSSDEYLDSSPEDQAAWLLVASYCANQENGGRIAGAKRWEDQKCQRALKVGRDRLHEKARLWQWDGDDLVVEFYPIEQELALKKKRGGASHGGAIRGAQLKAQAEARRQAEAKGQAQPMADAKLQRKGREGKGKKGNEKEGNGSLSADLSLVPSEEVVRAWAISAGVDPDFALQKRAELCERHGWFQNGHLLDWQSRFARFWETDQTQWGASRKKTPRAGGLPAEAVPTDPAWWWTDTVENVEAALTGASLQGDKKTAARLREVVASRKKGGG